MELRVEGEINRDDFAEATTYLTQKVRKKFNRGLPKIIGFFPMLAIGVVLGIAFGFLRSKHIIDIRLDYKTVAIIFAIFVPVYLIVKVKQKTLFRSLPSDDGTILGHRLFIIRDEGFTEETPKQTSLTKWEYVKGVEETAGQVLVFNDAHSAYFIPKRFFSSESECKEFVSALRERVPDIQG